MTEESPETVEARRDEYRRAARRAIQMQRLGLTASWVPAAVSVMIFAGTRSRLWQKASKLGLSESEATEIEREVAAAWWPPLLTR